MVETLVEVATLLVAIKVVKDDVEEDINDDQKDEGEVDDDDGMMLVGMDDDEEIAADLPEEMIFGPDDEISLYESNVEDF